MLKYFSFKKVKIIDAIYFFLLLLSLYLVKEINYLFFDSLQGPDISKYIIYINYFFQDNINTNLEHGLMYYYLHAIYFNYFYSNFSNLNLFLHKSILEVNFIIYLIGLLGYYKLLKIFKFGNKAIFLTLIFINFFPSAITMRLVLKPEILTFAFLPWLLFLLEKFKLENNYLHLISIVPILIATLSSKGNSLVIISTYLFIGYGKIILYKFNKKILVILLFFTILFMLITFENNAANGKSILDLQSGSTTEENYDFTASPSVMYKINIFKLFTSPIKHNFSNSFIGITLLETNGDYFDLYWDNDASEYFKNRKLIINFYETNNIEAPKIDFDKWVVYIPQQNSNNVYVRESLGMVISILMFFLLFNEIRKDKKYRFFYLAIFYGMFVILFHVITGIPSKNFDPNIGDTFKPLYYIFVFLLSYIFLIAHLFEKKILKVYYLLIYIFLILFILGFPKNFTNNTEINFIEKIENSEICKLEKYYFGSNLNIDSINCDEKTEHSDSKDNKPLLQVKPTNLLVIIWSFLVLFYYLFELQIKKLFRNFTLIKK